MFPDLVSFIRFVVLVQLGRLVHLAKSSDICDGYEGGFEVEGHCFKFFNDTYSWWSAMMFCQVNATLGTRGRLAQLTTEEKLIAVKENFASSTEIEFWIGLQRKYSLWNSRNNTVFPDNYVWIDAYGYPVHNASTNFSQAGFEVDMQGDNSNCVFLKFNATANTTADHKCSDAKMAEKDQKHKNRLCEFLPEPVTTTQSTTLKPTTTKSISTPASTPAITTKPTKLIADPQTSTISRLATGMIVMAVILYLHVLLIIVFLVLAVLCWCKHKNNLQKGSESEQESVDAKKPGGPRIRFGDDVTMKTVRARDEGTARTELSTHSNVMTRPVSTMREPDPMSTQ